MPATIAFTFPGQGSQKPGAGAAWLDHPAWAIVDVASQASGRDVAHLLLHAEADELKLTDNAQLSTYVASLLVLEAVRRAGVEPAYVAGHSLGEYTALTAAGVLSLADGVLLVSERGAAMRAACDDREGTMGAVVGASDDVVEAACAEARDGGAEVWVANYNAPGQVVIAGSPSGLEAGTAAARSRGVRRVLPLAVSGAFHTPFMAGAQDRLDAAIARAHLADATIPAAANVDAAPHRDGAQWASLLSRQLCSPVRWSQLVGDLATGGVDTFIEIGPGTVLSGMAKRAAPGATARAAASPDEVDLLVAALAGAS